MHFRHLASGNDKKNTSKAENIEENKSLKSSSGKEDWRYFYSLSVYKFYSSDIVNTWHFRLLSNC